MTISKLRAHSTRRTRTAVVLTLFVAAALLTSDSPRAQSEWALEMVASAGDAGFYNSLAFGADGTPAIAYSDGTNDDVRFAWREQDGVWQSELVDGGRNVQTGISLAYSGTGVPGISYGWGALKLAERGAQGWSIQTIAKNAANDVTSLVYRGTVPHVSFFSGSGKKGSLSFAYRPTSKWIIETVDQAGHGRYSSLAFDPHGRPVIAYAVPDYQGGSGTLQTLKVAVRQTTGLWVTTVVETGGTGDGVFASLAFSPDGNPVIVHGSGTVRFVEWIGDWENGSGAWTPSAVLDEGPFAGGESLVFDGDQPVVSWRQTDGTGSPTVIKVARETATGWEKAEVASLTTPWPFRISLALNGGAAAVTFCDEETRDLWFARPTLAP